MKKMSEQKGWGPVSLADMLYLVSTCQIYTKGVFSKIVNGLKPLTILQKSFVKDTSQGPRCTST